MAVKTIKGKDVGIYLNDILVGCAQEVSLSVSREEVETTCRASGDFKEYTPGDVEWSGSLSGAQRVATAPDAATNFTYENAMDGTLAGTLFTLKFGTDTEGDPVYSGQVFFTSAELSGSRSDATFSVSFRGTGALTKSLVPAE